MRLEGRVDLLLILVFGLLAGIAIGNAVGTMRAARRRRPRDLAVDAELQSARQRAERAAGEAQALRTKLAAADVLTARVAGLESDLAAADEAAERNAELASRLESQIAALRTGRRDRAADPEVAAKRPTAPAPRVALSAPTDADRSTPAVRSEPTSSAALEPLATTLAEPGPLAAQETPPDGVEWALDGLSARAATVAAEVVEPTAVVEPAAVEPTAVVEPDADLWTTDPGASEASPALDPRHARASPTRARQRHRPASPVVVEPEPVAPPELEPEPDPPPTPEVQQAPPDPEPELAPDLVATPDTGPVPTPDPTPPVPEVQRPAPHPRSWRPIRPGLSDPWTWLGTTSPVGIPYAEDDLQRIHGVGPYLARRLREEGVLTWRQVAEWDEDDMTLVSRRIGSFPDRIRREDWSGMARELHQATYGERLP